MKFISTNDAPAAIGPYSQAVIAGGFLFVSGQIPLDAATMELVDGTPAEQAVVCLGNLSRIVKAAGLDITDIAKVTVFTTQMSAFADINTVYADFFGDHRPARAVVEVSGLPKGVDVEIEAIVDASRVTA